MKKKINEFEPIIYLTLVGDLDVGYEEPKPTFKFNKPLNYKIYKVLYKRPKDNWVIVKDLSPGKAVDQANYFMHKYYPKTEPLVISTVIQE